MALAGYIYKTTNLINNKIYIGQHSGSDINYFGSGLVIRQAIKIHGKPNFKKEILINNIKNQNLLNELEKHYIQLYGACIKGIGYNIAKGGSGGMYGLNHSDEAKNKIGIANKGLKRSEEVKRQMSKSRKGVDNPMYGRRHTKEAINKMSKSSKGKTLSDEHRRKISKNSSRHNLGKKSSQETKDKISKNNARYFLGRKLSDEHRKNIGKGNSGTQRIVNCIHCNISGGASNMTRYHFDNCKYKQL